MLPPKQNTGQRCLDHSDFCHVFRSYNVMFAILICPGSDPQLHRVRGGQVQRAGGKLRLDSSFQLIQDFDTGRIAY